MNCIAIPGPSSVGVVGVDVDTIVETVEDTTVEDSLVSVGRVDTVVDTVDDIVVTVGVKVVTAGVVLVVEKSAHVAQHLVTNVYSS